MECLLHLIIFCSVYGFQLLHINILVGLCFFFFSRWCSSKLHQLHFVFMKSPHHFSPRYTWWFLGQANSQNPSAMRQRPWCCSHAASLCPYPQRPWWTTVIPMTSEQNILTSVSLSSDGPMLAKQPSCNEYATQPRILVSTTIIRIWWVFIDLKMISSCDIFN